MPQLGASSHLLALMDESAKPSDVNIEIPFMPGVRQQHRGKPTSHVDIEKVLREAGLIEKKEGNDPFKGLPTGECSRLRPPLLPKLACNTAQELAEKNGDAAKPCPPRPPSCCENARRAEAALKLAQQALSGSWILRHYHPNGNAAPQLAAAKTAVAPWWLVTGSSALTFDPQQSLLRAMSWCGSFGDVTGEGETQMDSCAVSKHSGSSPGDRRKRGDKEVGDFL
eukprot:TRINITY_DN46306_c0_g1_i1.p1 TRINITY_DN46306_c0_g1~~TRINITY_DN46306_c0_g1_i1.p1  ORF type:complete len:225 (+),score=43.82 TRINITY_DN46306_c0_g1_i1:152-826(+)